MAGWVQAEEENQVWIEDSAGATMLPPITKHHDLVWGVTLTGQIWADMPRYAPPYIAPYTRSEFLDYNFIYDPQDFLEMKGKKWATFRKNARKFPKRHKGHLNYYHMPAERHHYDDWYMDQLNEIVDDWSDGRKEIHDADVLIKYLLEAEHREVLTDQYGNVYGINIWDENYTYLNFRYCVCRTIPFVSEYMRWLFYTNHVHHKKLVNDGGALDNEELAKFKMKLNPVMVNTINSWKGV